jgi:nitroreductase
MEFHEAVHGRRSIRRFRPDPVPDEALTRMLEAARAAPSATNCQPWRFLVVRDEATRAALAEAAHEQRAVREAPVLVLVFGDRGRYRKRLRRGKELVETGAVDAETLERVNRVYRSRPEPEGGAERVIELNGAVAVAHLLLAARAEGLGAVWIGLFDREAAAARTGAPAGCVPVALVPVGVPDEAPAARPRYPLRETAFRETFDRPWPGTETDPPSPGASA